MEIIIEIDSSVHSDHPSARGDYDSSRSRDLVTSQCKHKLFQAQRLDQHCTQEPGAEVSDKRFELNFLESIHECFIFCEF